MAPTVSVSSVSTVATLAVIAAWGTLHTARSLEVLTPHLESEDTVNEAATSIVAVAAEVGKTGDAGKALATPALEAVIKACKNARIRGDARRALEKITG